LFVKRKSLFLLKAGSFFIALTEVLLLNATSPGILSSHPFSFKYLFVSRQNKRDPPTTFFYMASTATITHFPAEDGCPNKAHHTGT